MTTPTPPSSSNVDRLIDAWLSREPIDLSGPDPITYVGDPDDGWQPDQRIAASDIAVLMRRPIPADAAATPALIILRARITGSLAPTLPDTSKWTGHNCPPDLI